MIERTIEYPLPEISSSRSEIKGKFGKHTIIFPSSLVLDIVIVEHSKIFRIPFYPKSLLGIVYHQSKLIPLVYLEELEPEVSSSSRSSNHIMGVRLGPKAKDLNGIAVVIDQLLGDSPHELDNSQIDFHPSLLSPQIWRPEIEQAAAN